MKKSRIISLLFLLQLILMQQIYSQERTRVYEVPTKYVSLMLINDQKCPLQLDNPRFVNYEKGDFQKVYTILNRTNKSVKTFQIKELTWFGNQEYTKNVKAEDDFSLLPHESFSTLNNENELKFIDFDEGLVTKLRLSDHPKNIWIILVTKAELSDGTIYDITSKYETIEKYVQNLKVSPKMSLFEIGIKERELGDYISKTLNIEN